MSSTKFDGTRVFSEIQTIPLCNDEILPCPAVYISISELKISLNDFIAYRKHYISSFDVWGDDFMIDFWLKNPRSNEQTGASGQAGYGTYDILHITKDDTSRDGFKKSKIPVITFQSKFKGYNCGK